MKAVLLLEDGASFEGRALGAEGEAFGEVVFNTSMTGYQEVLTDPSYEGQIVAMSYPLIGNYGIIPEDSESAGPRLRGTRNGVVGIQGIDTRALVRHLRIHGAKHGAISSDETSLPSLASKLAKAPRIVGVDLVQGVSCLSPYEWTDGLSGSPAVPTRHHVVVLDCGVKYNILRHLVSVGCRVTVVPAATSAEEILRLRPHGLLLSNGPGDPEPVRYVVDTTRELLGKLPIFGICLGHQMLGLALGGRTYKLKFGHHGGNHPVKDVDSGRIAITSQNHGFNVDMESLPAAGTRTTHVNLYDGTTEGLENRSLGLFSVQYHPEAGPGPHDAAPLFGRFASMMDARR
jgi:carbamoyl-phosphate synthase small subunit